MAHKATDATGRPSGGRRAGAGVMGQGVEARSSPGRGGRGSRNQHRRYFIEGAVVAALPDALGVVKMYASTLSGLVFSSRLPFTF